MRYFAIVFWCMILIMLLPVSSPGLVPAILDDTYGYRLPAPAGIAVWWCEATRKVGRDRAAPVVPGSAVQISAARNEYEPFQVVLRPDMVVSNVTVSVSDFVCVGNPLQVLSATNVEVSIVAYVPVVEPAPHDGESIPGDWPDPLLPLTNSVTVAGAVNQPFWFSVYVPKELPAGDYTAELIFSGTGFSSFSVPVVLHIYDFSLSDVTHTESSFNADINPVWHRAYTTAEQSQVWDKYMQDFRRHRITPQAPHQYDAIRWQESNGDYIVDFSSFDTAMTRYLDEFGFTSFNLYNRGATNLPPSSLGGYAAYTPGYQAQLNKLFGKIMQHLREKGWADKAYTYEFDETSASQFASLLGWMDAVQQAAPDLRRLFAQNYAYNPQLKGRVDIWGPMTWAAISSQFLDRRQYGDELWWYVAVGPRSPYANRFVDHPAINTRIHYWLAERYGITGDIYWACNFWAFINPWEEARTSPLLESNGDGILFYPPTRTKPSQLVVAPPTSSMRWELLREGLEDAEYFWLLKQRAGDAKSRLGPGHPAVIAASNAYVTAMALASNLTSYTKNVETLMSARATLAVAIEGIEDGAPFFVRSPDSKAVASGGTVKLYSEALGRPPVRYQWRLDGSDLAGQTNNVLVLTNCGPAQLGSYTVAAVNDAGQAFSKPAVLGGYWSQLPDIIYQPHAVIQHEAEKAVLVVTAVSTNAMSYQWLCNGQPVTGIVSSNTTLLLTNLTAAAAGDYRVVISNSAGTVTSDVVRLSVLWSPYTASLASSNAVWRYNDNGASPGVSWKNVGYDDSAWKQGGALLGFGLSNAATTVATNGEPRPTTIYFRKSFELPEIPASGILSGQFHADDGVVIYLNGSEVVRYNMPGGTVQYDTLAASAIEGPAESVWTPFSVPVNNWIVGTNILAAEVHQCSAETGLSNGLAACWGLDESAAPWGDSAGTNSFLMAGSGVSAATGIIGGCAAGTNTSGWLEAADAPILRYSGPFTIGGWFKFPGLMSAPATCLQKQNEFSLYYTGSGKNRYVFKLGSTDLTNNTSVGTGAWCFISAWYDGTNASIQVNTGTVYSVAASAPSASTNPVQALKIGAASGNLSGDEMFFYHRVLSAAERSEIYTSGLRSLLTPSDLDMAFGLFSGTYVVQRPVFVESPASQMRWEGQDAAFKASVTSKTAVAYQWTVGGVPIAGATAPLLFLPGVSTNDAGSYKLTASNAGGGTDSDPATLDVHQLPVIRGQLDGALNGGLKIIVPPNPGYWQLLASSNLVEWVEVAVIPPGSDASLVEDTAASNATVRFYRLKIK